LQRDGKIILGGYTNIFTPPYYYFALTRYNGDKAGRYIHILKWLHHHGFTWSDCPNGLCKNLYIVERSANGETFSAIARIPGNSHQIRFEDLSPLNGINYYRLKSVSDSGSVAYSNVIAIKDETASIKIYPNPVTGVLHIQGLNNNAPTTLSVIDVNGGVLRRIEIKNESFTWNLHSLAAGSYYLRIEENKNVRTLKFVKEQE
jgi:hypothetical protein